MIAASLASAYRIWWILGRIVPDDQLLGTLLFLWNPGVIIEFGAEGHNDALMLMFVLASLALALDRRPGLSLLALSLGILTKYLPLIFLPALLLYLWHTSRPRHFVRATFLALFLSLLIAFLLFRPLWLGTATFEGVRLAGQPYESLSPSGALYSYLNRSWPSDEAAGLTTRLAAGALALLLLVTAWRARDPRRLGQAFALAALA